MKIVLSRIDNRLLHGITATQWAPKTKAHRIMVIDDVVAGDEMMKNTMKLARPAGMAISIISLQTALQNFKAKKYEGQSIFIITKRVEILKHLIDEADVPVHEINVGATAQVKDENSVLRVNRFTTVDDDEKKIYLELMDKGIEVYAKYLVSDSKQDMKDILK